MRILLNLTDILLAPAAVSAAFGYTDDGTDYVVNTGANLVVKVSKFNEDMTSNSAALKISVAFETLRHYFVFRYNNPNVYIFMNKPDDSVTVSRYIVRIPANVFKNNVNTDTDWVPDGATVIESGDVVGLNGQTWSKHYS
jgi:rhamnogalacturonan endolyase